MPTPVVKRRTKLVVGSTHTLLTAPITVFTVVELRRARNKRGTTSTIPVWRGRCKGCGEDFDFPRVIAPSVRRCERCRGVITGYTENSLDIPIDEHDEAEMVELAANAHRGRRADLVHEPVSISHTKPVFTDR